jgi:4'-phosphopantetheinyl transferase
MPLTHYITALHHARIGVWHITEKEDYFLKKMPMTDAELAELSLKRGHSRLEWLAARFLVQQMTGWAGKIVKDDYGKPHWEGSEYHLSMSHSKEYTAVIISTQLVGIDIQYITPKLESIAWRVMNDIKLINLDSHNRLAHLHVYWGAKEALYKAYGKRDLDFKAHLPISPFIYQNRGGVLDGRIMKGDYYKTFLLHYLHIDNYMLVYAIEK